jgi:hypothetical protein
LGRIPVGKFLRGGKGEFLLFLDGLAGAHPGAHTVHRVDGVNRRGPSGFERLANSVKVKAEFLQVASAKSQYALGQAVSRRCPNRPGTTHHHVVNGGDGLTEIFRGDDFELVGEPVLIDEQNFVPRGIEGDGAIMPGASADGDIHAITFNRP